MKSISNKPDTDSLRLKAEDFVKQNNPNITDLYPDSGNLRLIHELKVHQVELEIQNEELEHANVLSEVLTEKYTELYDFAPIGYFTLSKDGYINELNLVGASMLNKERTHLLNRIFAVFVSNDTKPVFKLFREKIFSSSALESCEIILSTDGSIPIYFHLTGIVSKNGDNCLVTATDITKQKQVETDLILKNLELEKLVVQKDKFFSIMAHDLRAPFSGFLGLTEIIATELPSLEPNEIQKMVASMRHSAINLYRLLENLLQWSQMEQGLIPFNPGVIRLHKFAEESLSSELITAENKGIEVIFEIPYDIFVFADVKMLRSILSNLYSNAIKFSSKGGQIIISARYASPKTVEISICDTGIGMSTDIQSKLFRLNEQVNRKGTDGELYRVH
jgi:signal transduction histidine kinase